MNQQLILIDEPYEYDERVLRLLQQYDDFIIIDCSHYTFKLTLATLFKEYFLLLTGISVSKFLYWITLSKEYDISQKYIFKGLKRAISLNIISKLIAKEIVQKYNHINVVHANDLFCGLVGKGISDTVGCQLTYDAHEVEFHRNRKNSLLRVILDMTLEQKVIDASEKVIVVNLEIQKLYQKVYKIPSDKIEIVDNNHFSPYMGYALQHLDDKADQIAIVYIGGGIKGRKLEALGQNALSLNVKVYGFFLSKTPSFAHGENWALGSKEYLPEFLEVVKKKRLLMWCCTEDLCLSYQLSLPNKFFQAMAVGIPVIAYKGTYLSKIVEEYNLGYIYDDENFEYIVGQLKDIKLYSELLMSVNDFQHKLFIEKLQL